ncbi:MAG: hypothetical protein P1U53_15610 [Sulfitobacter sp.]|nr:hypothetical protein [Sulfitobacter sp.]
MSDATKLDDLVGRRSSPQVVGIKNALLLFLTFLFVVSNMFASVIKTVPGATEGDDTLTNTGYAVQGVALVIIYAILTKIAETGIL